MNTKDIIEKLTQKKVQDYSFTIIFFFLFSFFVIGAIRPNILTVVRLQNELVELRKMDEEYEKVILNIVDNQSIIESNRDNFYLLDEAIPNKVQPYKLIDDLQLSAAETGITLRTVNVSEMQVKGSNKDKGVKTFLINLEASSDQVQLQNFVKNVLNQRRLKTINTFTVAAQEVAPDSSESATLSVTMEVSGYYSL